MSRIIPCILLILYLLVDGAFASELTKVVRIDKKDIIQIYFSFDTPPEFTSSANDRRIDLEFFNTALAQTVSLGTPDNSIVKILPRPADGKYVLSLFFRYQPQRYSLTKSGDDKLVFEVLLGNEYSKSYQNLASKLKGLTLLERAASDSTNPYLISPYVKDWMSFFSQYEASVKLAVPVSFHSPPFPLIGLLPPGNEKNLQLISTEMFELAKENLWDHIADQLLQLIKNTQDVEIQKLLALTYGEALGRDGNFEDAYKQLYLLKEQYPDELLGTYAGYLLIQLRANFGDIYIAENDYQALMSSIPSNLPLVPYFLLSEIETSLATGDYRRLNRLLQKNDVALPDEIAAIIQIRQADYWYAINQPVQAKAAYQLLSDSSLLQTFPYSLACSCNINYEHKKFSEAENCYNKLASLVSDKPLLGLIDYRKNMAKLKTAQKASSIDSFSHIENAFPETEAGFRAALKKNDLLFLQDKTWGLQAIANYKKIADQAHSRPIREEALFKQALVHAILGEATTAIDILQNFLREFLIGDIRISAQALLIELLPNELKRLVDNKEYISALVLAKQNKDLFQKNWIDNKFLVDIAEAYNRSGIFDEAQKLYLYLITVLPVDQREGLFLPMIQATFDHGNFALVDDYAAQYTYNYPNGSFSAEILLLRLQALMAADRFDDTLKLLPDPLPAQPAFLELAASLFYRMDNYQKCAAIIRKLALMKSPLSATEQFMFAESLYKTGNYTEAENQFSTITEENSFYEQSIYRLAEFARERGEEKKALSLFKKLVEREKNSLWKQYAERELQLAKIADRMKQ